jgi:thiamine-phosphate pyrophosphorylase
MRLYMITDRRLFAAAGDDVLEPFLDNVAHWASAGLDFIQVREKDLPSSELEQLTAMLRQNALNLASIHGIPAPAVLVNASDEQQVKVACKVADGVHLPGDMRTLTARVQETRALWSSERPAGPKSGPEPLVSVSCHTLSEVEEARSARASVILFAPVFEKPLRDGPPLPGVGLPALRAACLAAGPVPVFALGGVTLDNAAACVAAGAAGIAGIRLFASEVWGDLPGR